MAALYEINSEILSCIDTETGEISDIEKWEKACGDREKKLENIALWIKNLESDAIAFEKEEKAFRERKIHAENKAASLKILLSNELQGEKFSTEKCAVSFRKSVSVETDSTLSIEWCKRQEIFTPDKQLLRDRLKSGQHIIGAKLVEKQNIQIR